MCTICTYVHNTNSIACRWLVPSDLQIEWEPCTSTSFDVQDRQSELGFLMRKQSLTSKDLLFLLVFPQHINKADIPKGCTQFSTSAAMRSPVHQGRSKGTAPQGTLSATAAEGPRWGLCGMLLLANSKKYEKHKRNTNSGPISIFRFLFYFIFIRSGWMGWILISFALLNTLYTSQIHRFFDSFVKNDFLIQTIIFTE